MVTFRTKFWKMFLIASPTHHHRSCWRAWRQHHDNNFRQIDIIKGETNAHKNNLSILPFQHINLPLTHTTCARQSHTLIHRFVPGIELFRCGPFLAEQLWDDEWIVEAFICIELNLDMHKIEMFERNSLIVELYKTSYMRTSILSDASVFFMADSIRTTDGQEWPENVTSQMLIELYVVRMALYVIWSSSHLWGVSTLFSLVFDQTSTLVRSCCLIGDNGKCLVRFRQSSGAINGNQPHQKDVGWYSL